MILNQSHMDFETAKTEIETEMINDILGYLKYGNFPKNKNKPKSFMNAYTAVNKCVDEGDDPSRQLLDYHNEIIKEYIEECFIDFKKENERNLIEVFIRYSDRIKELIYWMNIIFTYLDRFFTKAKVKVSLAKGALNLYQTYFFEDLQIDLFIKINELIKEDRKGNKEFRKNIKIVMKTIRCLDMELPKIVKEKSKIVWITDTNNQGEDTNIQDIWYKNFENETKKFAEEKGKRDIQSMSAPEYVISQLKYLDDEYEREKEFINEKYHEGINQINYKYLIGAHMEDLSAKETGIKNMFKTKNYTQLINLYKLFKLYKESLDKITNEFKLYIKKRGNMLYENKNLSKDPIKFIPELMSLKREMDNLVYECFEDNIYFHNVIDEAFKLFMEKDIYAKQLANYIDHCMRNNFKNKSEAEIEKILNNIIYLFKCLNTKLVFQNEANKKMSDRLIKKKSISDFAERSLIRKLMQENGISYVSKMQEMMKDLDKNKNDMNNYKLSEHKGAPGGIKLEVTVVSQSAWEINKKSFEKFILPNYLNSCLDNFQTFYLKRHQAHKLIWCLGLSEVSIEYLYLKKATISISTLPQLLTLLLLEQNDKLSLGKIAELCGCQLATIITDINGLIFSKDFNPKADPKKGIIKSNLISIDQEFKESDEISINKDFFAERLKISTQPLTKKKSESEKKAEEDEEAIILKRKQDNIIQATLTRIMKSRNGQETTHTWLVNAASRQIDQVDLFQVQPTQIKENIEKLIEKNIIKRNERNRNCYDYIA